MIEILKLFITCFNILSPWIIFIFSYFYLYSASTLLIPLNIRDNSYLFAMFRNLQSVFSKHIGNSYIHWCW